MANNCQQRFGDGVYESWDGFADKVHGQRQIQTAKTAVFTTGFESDSSVRQEVTLHVSMMLMPGTASA